MKKAQTLECSAEAVTRVLLAEGYPQATRSPRDAGPEGGFTARPAAGGVAVSWHPAPGGTATAGLREISATLTGAGYETDAGGGMRVLTVWLPEDREL